MSKLQLSGIITLAVVLGLALILGVISSYLPNLLSPAQQATPTLVPSQTPDPAQSAAQPAEQTATQEAADAAATVDADGPVSSPQPTYTPSQTLLPPPTFEPSTATVLPSDTPTATPTATLNTSISIPGLHGAETPTPTSTQSCEPRKDWGLTYTVQRGDALARIAEQYGTTHYDLAAGNCLSNPDLIVEGQVLRVPGDAPPAGPVPGVIECVEWEVYTPIDGAFDVPYELNETLTFNWRGPEAPRNLVRILRPDGTQVEKVVDLRQNVVVDVVKDLNIAGLYYWYVYPLGEDFLQINCLEGGPWTFTKEQSPTHTPVPTATPEDYGQDQVPIGGGA